MFRVLIPVDGSSNSQQGVRHVIRQFRLNPEMTIHLLNVQPPFSRNITRFVDRKMVHTFHHEESQKALQPNREILDKAGTPYVVHHAVGKPATLIAQIAQQLHCDHIVIGTARKNSLLRGIEGSVTNEVIELATVPVVAIAGETMSKAERYGIPVSVGAMLGWLIVAALE